MRVFISLALIVTMSLTLGCKQDPPELKPAAKAQKVPIHQPKAPATGAQGVAAATPAQQQALPPGHPPVPSQGGAVTAPSHKASGKAIVGKIAEIIPAGKYVYLKLESGGEIQWAAVTKAELTIGQEVRVTGAALMQNFTSPTLKRTFDAIWFGNLDGVREKPKTAAAPAAQPPTAGPATPAPEGAIKVAELFAQKDALAGKQVTLHGKVVKFNSGIMDRNWIHLQDGSGTAEAKNNDILVTTATGVVANLGDTVTIQGLVALDQNFGHGYKYPVVVERGSIMK